MRDLRDSKDERRILASPEPASSVLSTGIEAAKRSQQNPKEIYPRSDVIVIKAKVVIASLHGTVIRTKRVNGVLRARMH